MKILFKVIVLVSVLVCCIYLWKMFNGLHITKAQFAISYGLVILSGGLFVGWLTDLNFNNQSLYDNREADPLSDWVKIQDRAKGKGDFWKGLVSDSNMDDLIQWELGNYYDRNELKSVEEIINKPKDLLSVRPITAVDEVHHISPEKFRELTTGIEFEKRQQYREPKKVNIPAWLFDEAGDSVNPLDHEQSK